MITSIDLNCDMGEGSGCDAGIMPYISSANIACGGHAGDPATMRATVALARQHGVAVGAHPGLEDRVNFGRQEIPIAPGAIHELVRRQVNALREFGQIRHVKPHGALYNMAERDPAIAAGIAGAVWEIDPELILVGLAGGSLLRAGRSFGLRTAGEGFADRTYRSDGSLTPRAEAGALIADPDAALRQVLLMLNEGIVRTTDGGELPIRPDTLCIHGDGQQPIALARHLRSELAAAGVEVTPAH